MCFSKASSVNPVQAHRSNDTFKTGMGGNFLLASFMSWLSTQVSPISSLRFHSCPFDEQRHTPDKFNIASWAGNPLEVKKNKEPWFHPVFALCGQI
jgi:hypothetical protein